MIIRNGRFLMENHIFLCKYLTKTVFDDRNIDRDIFRDEALSEDRKCRTGYETVRCVAERKQNRKHNGKDLS